MYFIYTMGKQNLPALTGLNFGSANLSHIDTIIHMIPSINISARYVILGSRRQ